MTTTMTTPMTAPAAIHPFEKAGLGRAPFRCVGSFESKYQAAPGAPVQPGSSCDFCGTGIMDVYVVRSADRREFKVGCDCIRRVTDDCARTDAERAAAKLWADVLKIRRERAHKSADRRIEAARATLAARTAELAEIEQPGKFSQSVAQWAEWMLAHAGRKGCVDVAKRLEGIGAELGW